MKRRVFLHIYFTVIVILFAVFSLHAIFADAPAPTAVGIDISHHEGEIEWDKIKAQYDAGTLNFVIIRCGSGTSVRDKYWKVNADACRRLGIPFGVYLYSKATSVAAASAEADVVLNLIDGYNLSYPVYYDIEDSTQKTLGADLLKNIFHAFGEKIKAAGYECGVYSSRFWLEDQKLLGSIDFEAENYSVWAAEYAPVLNYSGKYDIWQRSEDGIVDGIEDKVDINYLYIEPRTADHCYVTFDAGDADAEAPSPIHLEKGETYGELPKLTSPDGRHFGGWYDGARRIEADDVLETAGKLTLCARWFYRVEVAFERAVVTDGTATAEITKKSPEYEVSFSADEGYFLPDKVELPEGFSYSRSGDKRSAIISGIAQSDVAMTVTALPELDRRIVFDGEYISTGMKNATFTVGGESFDTDKDGALKIDESWLGKTLAVTYPGGDATVTLTLPARRNAPELSVRDETYLNMGDGGIVGLDPDMEYSDDGGETFSDCPPEKFECGVEYIIRYKATDADFCGKTTSVTIKSGRKIVVTFIVEGETFMSYEVGYGETVEVPELPALENCDMENSHWDIDLTGVEITGDVTVTAVYQKLDGCGRPIKNEAAILLVAVSALAFVIFKKKN